MEDQSRCSAGWVGRVLPRTIWSRDHQTGQDLRFSALARAFQSLTPMAMGYSGQDSATRVSIVVHQCPPGFVATGPTCARSPCGYIEYIRLMSVPDTQG